MLSKLHPALTARIFWNVLRSTPYSTYKSFLLFMQELLVNKIHFFKVLTKSDKAGLDLLKIITVTHSTSLSESFHLSI